MKKQVVKSAGFLFISFVLLTVIYSLRPLTETALIRQTRGVDVSKPYLGRTLMVLDGKKLRQNFAAPRDGSISAVGIFMPQPNRTARGSLWFELIKLGGQKELPLVSVKSNISRLSNNDGLSIWRFPKIKVSKGERFTIQLRVKAEPGLLIFISDTNAYKGGKAAANGKPLGVDLAFQVFYKLSGRDFGRLLAGDSLNLIGPAPLSLALLALWIVLGAWLNQLWLLAASWTKPEIQEGSQ